MTGANTLIVENLERIAQDQQAIFVKALNEDADLAARMVNMVCFAWPYLNSVQRARILVLCKTPEVNAAVAARARELGLQ